jgi:hypothetical protein
MHKAVSFGLALTGLSLTACEQKPPEASPDLHVVVGEEPVPPPGAAPVVPVAPPSPPTPSGSEETGGENDGTPDITPAPLAARAAKTEKGARANLLAWARGIEMREFDQAWQLMGDAAKAQRSKAQFNALFHPLQNITVAVSGGDMEGAAGSIYYTVPTTISGTGPDGGRQVLKGEVVLRRVNDVDGATPSQLKWHIVQVDLAPA